MGKEILHEKEPVEFIEYCNHCGKSVSFGSGRFVNRVVDFNDILTRIQNGLDFPMGDFICGVCDSEFLTDDPQ